MIPAFKIAEFDHMGKQKVSSIFTVLTHVLKLVLKLQPSWRQRRVTIQRCGSLERVWRWTMAPGGPDWLGVSRPNTGPPIMADMIHRQVGGMAETNSNVDQFDRGLNGCQLI